MGLLDFLKYTQFEKSLLELFTRVMISQGISTTEAKKGAKDMLDQAIEESKKDGTYNFPPNLGDIILGHINTDNPTVNGFVEKIRQQLPKIEKEGVRYDDVRWWWNLNDIERRMMLKDDDVARMMLFMSELQKSKEDTKEKAADIAAAKVRRFHPMYGDPSDTTKTSGDDRPLPYELKDRINIYSEKRATANSEKFKNDIAQSSSFNALIRKEIRAKNL